MIIITVMIGIAVVVATIVVGSRTFEGTVVRDPYETGLQWDAVRKARQESGWIAQVMPRDLPAGRSELIIDARDRQGQPLQKASVTVALSRPETVAYDRTYTAVYREPGVFTMIVDLPKPGRWEVRITIAQDSHAVVFDDAVNVRAAR